ncbi:MAG: type II secretion system protein GspM [Pseudomonadota bacterium]
MIARVLDRFSAREQVLLLAATALLAAAGFYTLVAEPLIQDRARLREAVAREAAVGAWLQDQSAAFTALGRVPAGVQPAAALPEAPRDVPALETRLREAGLDQALTRLAPQGAGAVDLSFEAVSYVALTEWMLREGLAHRLTSLNMQATDAPDRVDARLTVSLAAVP